MQHTAAQGCQSLGVTSQQKAQPLAQLLNEGQGRDAGGGSAQGLWEPVLLLGPSSNLYTQPRKQVLVGPWRLELRQF